MINFLTSILYILISIVDKIDYLIIKKGKLLDNVKTIEEYFVNGMIQVKTDTGFSPVSEFIMTKPFLLYIITLENGVSLTCADTHILFTSDLCEIFAKDINIGTKLYTIDGPQQVISVRINRLKICMADLSLDDNNHRFFTNGILSHNSTTTAIECLHSIIFNTDYAGLVLSKSGAAGRDLMSKIKDMYRYLPDFLKPGINKWNVSEMMFDNNSGVYTEAFSDTAGLGHTLNFLILDEFAWCPASQVELFYNNVIPTVTTMPDAKVRIMSTQNGHNYFYQLWRNATVGDPETGKKSGYGPFKVDWYQVPQLDKETHQWKKRDEAWKQMMIGKLGSLENFEYQYGTTFYSSDKCILNRHMIAKIHEGEKIYEPYTLDDFPMGYWNPEMIPYMMRESGWDYDYHNTWGVILCDLAEGSGGDFTVFQFCEWDGKTLRQRALFRSNEFSLDETATFLYLLCTQFFNPLHTIVSIEWNTYGPYFYKCIIGCQDKFDQLGLDFETGMIVWYPKTEQDVANKQFTGTRIPGLPMTIKSKKTSCTLLKNEFAKDLLFVTNIDTIAEIENFEEKGGSYQAARGHDDCVMPFVQIPKLKESAKWVEFREDYREWQLNSIAGQPAFNPYEELNPMTNMQFYQLNSAFSEEDGDIMIAQCGGRQSNINSNVDYDGNYLGNYPPDMSLNKWQNASGF